MFLVGLHEQQEQPVFFAPHRADLIHVPPGEVRRAFRRPRREHVLRRPLRVSRADHVAPPPADRFARAPAGEQLLEKSRVL